MLGSFYCKFHATLSVLICPLQKLPWLCQSPSCTSCPHEHPQCLTATNPLCFKYNPALWSCPASKIPLSDLAQGQGCFPHLQGSVKCCSQPCSAYGAPHAIPSAIPVPRPSLASGCLYRCSTGCCSTADSCSLVTLPTPLLGSSHAVLFFAGLLNQSRNSILQNIQSVRLFFRPSAGSLNSLGWKGLLKSSNQPPK